jgi:hypothetical protein
MKRLKKLELHNFEKICVDEQKSMKGGGEFIIGPDGNQYCFVGEAEVAAFKDAYCPRCEQNAEYGIVPNPIYSTENRSLLDTFSEFLSNTLPHILGSGGHINESYTIYRLNIDGQWTPWVPSNQ